MIGQIIMFGGNFAPRGWAFCDGRILSISENDALYSLLGTTYYSNDPGDGITSFALPDLRGRVPIQAGHGDRLSNYGLGQSGGVEGVTLDATTLPSHTHTALAKMPYTEDTGDESMPTDTNIFANGSVKEDRASYGYANIYKDTTATSRKNLNVEVTPIGGGLSHENRQPFLAVNYIIALKGTFPSRN